jgi:tetratricopeptide (TPR) repeat protein
MTGLQAAGRALAHEDWALGRDLLLQVVDERPDWADAWALLGGAHLAMAEVDAANAAAERALALAPDGFLPRMKAGELALRLGDLETAERHLLAAVRATEPDTADATAARRALVLARRGTRAGIAHRASLPHVPLVGRAGRLLRAPLSRFTRVRRTPPVRETT